MNLNDDQLYHQVVEFLKNFYLRFSSMYHKIYILWSLIHAVFKGLQIMKIVTGRIGPQISK